MNNNITLSINPWYYCNFRCNFCYLTEAQLSNKQLLGLDRLEQLLEEVSRHRTIECVDLYGGEIGLLPIDYQIELYSLLVKHNIDSINIITNLSVIPKIARLPNVNLSVSYDFECREQHTKVFDNMMMLDKPFNILILASPQLMKSNVDEQIVHLNKLSYLSSVEIKPYSSNQANQLTTTYLQFEDYVKQWIVSTTEKRFEFVNEFHIQDVISKDANSFSNDHVYITPEGRFAVLEFDLNDNEYFKTLDNFSEYLQWAMDEPVKNISDICKRCEYYGGCLTEHYRYVTSTEAGCNGFYNLIKWYKNERS
jgi:MoaA/NifB/PqqE/SkfB family radical SAM enzyme